MAPFHLSGITYTYIHLCTHTHTYIHIHTHTHIQRCIPSLTMYTSVPYAHIYTHTYTHKHTIYTCLQLQLYTHMYKYMYKYIYICQSSKVDRLVSLMIVFMSAIRSTSIKSIITIAFSFSFLIFFY